MRYLIAYLGGSTGYLKDGVFHLCNILEKATVPRFFKNKALIDYKDFIIIKDTSKEQRFQKSEVAKD